MGYDDRSCFLPLSVFNGDHLLVAWLRRACPPRASQGSRKPTDAWVCAYTILGLTAPAMERAATDFAARAEAAPLRRSWLRRPELGL